MTKISQPKKVKDNNQASSKIQNTNAIHSDHSKPNIAELRGLQNTMGNYAAGEFIQAKFASSELPSEKNVHQHIHQHARLGVQGTGQKLPYYTKLQQAFGNYDLDNVKAYTDKQAGAASQAINADAYATGNKVAFANSQPSLHTVAHEVTHILQQRNGVNLNKGVGKIGDKYEQQADAVADAVVRGKSAEGILQQTLTANAPANNADSSYAVQRKIIIDKKLDETADKKTKASSQTYENAIFNFVFEKAEGEDDEEKIKKTYKVKILESIQKVDPSIVNAWDSLKLHYTKQYKVADKVNEWATSKEVDKHGENWFDIFAQALEEINAGSTAIAQIQLDDEDKIALIVLGGRGMSPYTDGMGNHTTAWTVLSETIKGRLADKTIDEAIAEFKEIVNQAEALPGMGLVLPIDTKLKAAEIEVNTAEDKVKAEKTKKVLVKLAANYNQLKILISKLNDAGNDLQKMVLLQQAISVYFNFRNLIPLTTINDSAGKGRGESGYINYLRECEYEYTYDSEADYKDLILAYALWNGLLDPTPINEVISEDKNKKKERSVIAPGLKEEDESKTILLKIIEQHFLTLKQSFPKTIKGFINAFADSKVDKAKALFNSLHILFDDKVVKDKISELQNAINDIEKSEKFENLNKDIRKYKQDKKNRKALPFSEDTYKSKVESLKEMKNEIQSQKADLKVLKLLSNKSFREQWKNIHDLFESNSSQQSIVDKVLDLDVTTNYPEISENNQAIQIILDDHNIIKDIKINRDDDSGLPGTKGAHTTSYIVHIDALTRPLLNKTLEEGAKFLLKYSKHIKKMPIVLHYYDKLNAILAEISETETIDVDNASDPVNTIYSASQFDYPVKSAMLTSNKEYLYEDMVPTLKKAKNDIQIVNAMQSLIDAILIYLNAVPFATTSIGDTTGHGEGAARRVLIETEKELPHSPENIINAIWQLFDNKALDEALDSTSKTYEKNEIIDITSWVYAHHIHSIKQAYPKSVEKSNAFADKNALKKPLEDNRYSEKIRKKIWELINNHESISTDESSEDDGVPIDHDGGLTFDKSSEDDEEPMDHDGERIIDGATPDSDDSDMSEESEKKKTPMEAVKPTKALSKKDKSKKKTSKEKAKSDLATGGDKHVKKEVEGGGMKRAATEFLSDLDHTKSKPKKIKKSSSGSSS